MVVEVKQRILKTESNEYYWECPTCGKEIKSRFLPKKISECQSCRFNTLTEETKKRYEFLKGFIITDISVDKTDLYLITIEKDGKLYTIDSEVDDGESWLVVNCSK